MSMKYLLANPNLSEGKDLKVIEEIVDSVRNLDSVKLVKVEPEGEFNRTVVTLVGPPDPLRDAVAKLTAKAVELIDMRNHSGTHPRIGAMDVIPVYPFKNTKIKKKPRSSARTLAIKFSMKSRFPFTSREHCRKMKGEVNSLHTQRTV
ncbi:hypothetical protein MASR1M66_15960 [Aminivibrio sp.]